jgi:hemoglobin-like flavoprotein
MPSRRHLPGAREPSGDGEQTSRYGLLAWWQRRSWRTDLEVLARVRDGLKRLDAEPGGGPVAPPPAGTADVPVSAPTLADTGAGAETPALADAPVQAPPAPADLLPDAAIASIRETFAIVAAAGEQPASYFYGRLFAGHPHLRGMFPPAMDVQRDRLLRALIQIVEDLTSPEDLVRYLSQLGRDHRKYSVEPAMYDAVGEALIATLRAYAGPAFTQDAQEAWVQAYQARSPRCRQRPGRWPRHGAPASHGGSGSRWRAERAAGHAAGLTRGISACASRRPAISIAERYLPIGPRDDGRNDAEEGLRDRARRELGYEPPHSWRNHVQPPA